jgi:hypothetical protein
MTRRLLRFALGSLMLLMLAGFFMSGVTPPGAAGEVLRHNRADNIDASPLFYSEVEHMSDLERGVRELIEANSESGAPPPIDSSAASGN